ncbi:MAG: DMT family transporter [Pseudomonadota bacterium]
MAVPIAPSPSPSPLQVPTPDASGPVGAGLDRTGLGLYALIVLVWGTSWIMIHYALGVTPVEITVALRFWLACAIMFAIVVVRGERWRFSRADHLWFAGMGALIFSTNFVLFYHAGLTLATGLLAVVFSMATLYNMGLSVLLEGARLPARVLLGGVMGVGGLCLIFWPELRADMGSAPAIGLALLGTLSFSLGNIAAQRVRSRGLPVIGSTAWGMLYGSLFLTGAAILFTMLGWIEPVLDTRPAYWLSLIGQSVFATVTAFLTYIALLRRIGTARAGYATVMFPLIALAMSTWLEGYVWSGLAVAGLVLILAGNVAVLTTPRRR